MFCFFFFNDTATTEIYTLHIVGSVRCVQETALIALSAKFYECCSFLTYSNSQASRIDSNSSFFFFSYTSQSYFSQFVSTDKTYLSPQQFQQFYFQLTFLLCSS
eukprot:TRINITY_DN29829_c0_g1_i1.p3 TRINITY_DN29829_c0_g1~~TRINITY_DN29829_c0_g1_i1.p3  ORF type:complete len:104 (+),score=26.44 TRINITY_DN29829_c0_g1_i1:123-434(+)